ncbi:MAG: hypothetical protein U9Q97_03735 [Acidobacteriota bacterium]|nr:hypothetical protein [Acidobacteriota bacterium]
MGKKRRLLPFNTFSINLKSGENHKEWKFRGKLDDVVDETISLFRDKYQYDIEELLYGKKKKKGKDAKKDSGDAKRGLATRLQKDERE